MKDLILKYLLNEKLSNEDYAKLDDWLKKDKNQQEFKRIIRESYYLNSSLNKINEEKALEKVNKAINNQKHSNNKGYWKYIAAASVVLLVSLSVFLNSKQQLFERELSEEPAVVATPTIEIGTDKAVLTLANGEDIELEDNPNFTNANVTSNGRQIVYNSNAEANPNKQVEYNYLTVPRGGQYQLLLSDGTEVWLNSESQLKYPVRFIEESRKVELVYGEAYFDVSPATNHDGAKFMVITGTQEVEVLGTEFNIKSYKDEDITYTTLAEGKVTVKEQFSSAKTLKPGEQLVFNRISNTQDIINVDVAYETAWKRGVFSFRSKSLKNIAKVLSRWYNVDIIFMDKELEQVLFKGVLSKNQELEEILTIIKNTKYINAYDIKHSTIIIK